MMTSLSLVMLLLFAIGMPIAFAITMASIGYVAVLGLNMLIVPQRLVGMVDNFTILAAPLFILAGELMNAGGITDRLIRLSRTMVGHLTGGLCHVGIVTNMIMAGISGSATADAGATGQVLVPAMVKRGYPRGFSAALIASAATIGPIIPPSIPMVLLGAIGEVSVARLFLGGVIPGLIMGVYLMIVAYIISKRRQYPREERATFREFLAALIDAAPALALPVVIIGGIVSGMFTATEAGAVAVVWALIVGMLVYRELKWHQVPAVLLSSLKTMGTVLFILATAGMLGWIMGREQLSVILTNGLLGLGSTWLVLLVVNVALLFLGCFIDALALLLLFTPTLIPLAPQLGLDPVHFGVVIVLNLMIGTITPPFGMVMYVMLAISKTSMARFTREMLPFGLALIAVLMLITYVPGLVLWIPNAVMGPMR
jgi:tripartite ATP-independent transporter DctM subunit